MDALGLDPFLIRWNFWDHAESDSIGVRSVGFGPVHDPVELAGPCGLCAVLLGASLCTEITVTTLSSCSFLLSLFPDPKLPHRFLFLDDSPSTPTQLFSCALCSVPCAR